VGLPRDQSAASPGRIHTFAALLVEAGLRIDGFKPLYVNPEQSFFWAYDPELGWAHRPGQTGVFEFGTGPVEVRINPKDLRDDNRPYARPDDRPRMEEGVFGRDSIRGQDSDDRRLATREDEEVVVRRRGGC
jgi:hypothetical protein